MKVCPECGSKNVRPVGVSGFSGVSGYSGAIGMSGISGYSGYSGKTQQAVSGFSASGVRNPNVMATSFPMQGGILPSQPYVPAPKPFPGYEPHFQCSDCNWYGKESDLIDDFKYVIKKVLKANRVEPPLPPIINEKVKVEEPVIEIKEKSVWTIVADKLLGEKKEGI
jgi:hypothetical protein